jgi:hypothetical protein
MADEEILSQDELLAAMERDELEGATKLSPREYGKLRGISPQLVYYHIRQGKVQKETCICGRSVIDVDLADQFFKKGQYSDGADVDPESEGSEESPGDEG